MKKIRKIAVGEEFYFFGTHLKCIEVPKGTNCKDCRFCATEGCCYKRMVGDIACTSKQREDGKTVIFVKIK